ncbi:MAG: hypothetical protein PHG96_12275 [Kiritimatiellae bacterium]|nr:hypothetical protein [Kiritimatiellia bacterium]
MNYLAVKDLKAPKLVRETLAEYGTALITNNGKPMALLVDLLEGESAEALSEALCLARARLALTDLRALSRRNGTGRLTGTQIDAEVRAARAARKRQRVRS